ncbi:hypothetical protein [Haloarcula onubensis]|uniref:Uncharacterized protein n=1 Tax=Haloarcula onubensis TaxID=2950539 RepID=A0ABU2FW37_9EURY|nr:hypothetical protein [Halomicroarcula sp. S3CR25-11]MDS0284452.1 hypothetical protein [Halomicroarcula sp. S3CR25-11]
MGFDDLDEAMSEQDAEETTTPDTPEDDRQEPAQEPTANLERPTGSTTDATEDDSSTSSLDHPAFPFEDSKQEAIYPTVETLTEFDDTLDFEVKRRLRDEGLRDVPKREYHEALLQLAIEQPERLAELIIENRR